MSGAQRGVQTLRVRGTGRDGSQVRCGCAKREPLGVRKALEAGPLCLRRQDWAGYSQSAGVERHQDKNTTSRVSFQVHGEQVGS